jgi:hypothetical protein
MADDLDPRDDEAGWAPRPDGEDPEPDWAGRIRAGRVDRGRRLREVYARFAQERTPLDDPERDDEVVGRPEGRVPPEADP